MLSISLQICVLFFVCAVFLASDEAKRLQGVLAGVEFYWANNPDDGSFGLYCPPCGKVIKGGGGKTVTNIKNHFDTTRHETAWKEWFKVQSSITAAAIESLSCCCYCSICLHVV